MIGCVSPAVHKRVIRCFGMASYTSSCLETERKRDVDEKSVADAAIPTAEQITRLQDEDHCGFGATSPSVKNGYCLRATMRQPWGVRTSLSSYTPK